MVQNWHSSAAPGPEAMKLLLYHSIGQHDLKTVVRSNFRPERYAKRVVAHVYCVFENVRLWFEMLNLQFFSVEEKCIKMKWNIVPRMISKCLLCFRFKKNIFTANTDWDWVGTITISEKCCCTKNWKVKVERCCLAENPFLLELRAHCPEGPA